MDGHELIDLGLLKKREGGGGGVKGGEQNRWTEKHHQHKFSMNNNILSFSLWRDAGKQQSDPQTSS